MLDSRLIAHTQGVCNPQNTVTGQGFRITVLEARLFRIEIQKNNKFEDRASQTVWFRHTPDIDFVADEDKRYLWIDTGKVYLLFDKKRKKIKSLRLGADGERFKPTDKGNLKGTTRTLDMSFGPVKLGRGLISKRGYALLDDSKSLVLSEEGQPIPRDRKGKDYYIFAFGQDYRGSIEAFYQISGPPPRLPRYAFGVWWSRFKAYSQAEYLELMEKFESEGIPLTVATVDMDWHWTDLNRRFGTKYRARPLMDNPCTGGWTGYSWNTELFPDYRDFLKKLKAKRLAVTLNLHPADGIRFHEDMYEEMAAAMGLDPESKKAVEFSPENPNFWNNYFKLVLHPYEEDGVDFWWIDWQQGKRSAVRGLDPLWALNHFHFLDQAARKKTPLILSRYAGPGSHRYPLGFSGDAVINWSVLRFQPYFTATAANIGYSRWSHDIGGHALGKRDDELYLRWLQFGVFSPVMRLHSTSGKLLGKEPWTYTAEIAALAKEQLVLRHKLIPYIYACDCETHLRGRALCEPLYYSFPDQKDSYKYKRQYMFGRNLLVIPIGRRSNRSLKLASTRAWIPPGRWTDIFTGEVYEGEQRRTLYRDLGSMPVLAKAGALIPLSDDPGNSCSPPQKLTLWVYRGQGGFDLYEGDSGAGGEACVTRFSVTEGEKLIFEAKKPEGDTGCLPQKRDYKIVFKDIREVDDLKVFIDELPAESFSGKGLVYGTKPFEVEIKNLDISHSFRLEIFRYKALENKTEQEKIAEIFSLWQANNLLKMALYAPIKKLKSAKSLRFRLKILPLPPFVKKCLLESLKQ